MKILCNHIWIELQQESTTFEKGKRKYPYNIPNNIICRNFTSFYWLFCHQRDSKGCKLSTDSCNSNLLTEMSIGGAGGKRNCPPLCTLCWTILWQLMANCLEREMNGTEFSVNIHVSGEPYDCTKLCHWDYCKGFS